MFPLLLMAVHKYAHMLLQVIHVHHQQHNKRPSQFQTALNNTPITVFQ